MYAYFRRFPHFGSFLFIFLSFSLIFLLGAQTSSPSAATEPVAPSAFAMPADFAPLPLTLSSDRASQQKRLAALLRGFEAVQSAEVLLNGEMPQGVAAQVLLKPRAGRELPPEMLESLARLLTEACPGLQSARLTIIESNGELLYAQGQVQTAALPVHRQSPVPWLLGVLVLGVGIAVAVRQTWLKRSLAPADPFAFLNGLDARHLQGLLRDERPELAAVLARQVQGPSRRRIEAWLRGRQVGAPRHELEKEVRDALMEALRRKYQRL